DGVARVTFRLDLRRVLEALRTRGYYDPPLGTRIRRGQLQHIYIIGEPSPLTWDLHVLRPGSPLELTDPDGDGIYEGTVPIETQYTRPKDARGRAIWARTADLSAFPRVTSSQRLEDALYRLSLEELTQLVRPDSALSAGAKWPGVWTRDISLSTILSLAIVAPDAARKSLMVKVDSSGRIIQDTGTGGSWPISSDRMVWALAAWEVYAETGDRAWLRQSYDIIRRSAEADLHAMRDRATGLFHGESSFMDWREQSYPRWMQPADIYTSENLGTNVEHYAAYRILARMARALGEPGARWDAVADTVRAGLSRELWQPDRGWFAEYRYGRTFLTRSPRAESLGEWLSCIYGAALPAQCRTVMTHSPIVAYGAPTFWPYIPGERLYHNGTIWPFVTAYWTWAASDARNTAAVERGLDDAARATALFLTNKENMVAATGHFEGTALNSDRQLWSVAGSLANTFRVLLGMRLEPDRLVLRPMVPPSLGGTRTATDVRYRDARLTIVVRGFGNAVASMRLDGKPVAGAEMPATLMGPHRIEITMNGQWPRSTVHLVPSRFAPPTPSAIVGAGALSWNRASGVNGYVVYRDGAPVQRTTSVSFATHAAPWLAEYQVLASDAAGDESFLSEPLRVVDGGAEILVKPSGVELERADSGFTGGGYARLTRERNTTISIPVRVTQDGVYAVDCRYANGSGPVNTADMVAVRTLIVDADTAGVVVLPQRGENRWSDWGWSNVLHVPLRAGTHTLTLAFTPFDENMNRHVNTALLDEVRLTPLAPSNATLPSRGRR
ncbi:MAG TPA: glycogen debranching protein, partial [Acidimicrobiia bacterium]|nr:glycogen debranching protein [Acidimicrobiia bacterium]